MTPVKGFLIITLLLAWFLRVYGLDRDGFWYDEVFSQDLVEQSSLRAAYQVIAHDDHPPLYDLGVMYSWAKLGKNEFFHKIFHDDMYATRSTIEVAYLDYRGEQRSLQSRK